MNLMHNESTYLDGKPLKDTMQKGTAFKGSFLMRGVYRERELYHIWLIFILDIKKSI